MILPGEEWGRHPSAPPWAAVVPISNDHHCEFCGTRDWAWVYPLLNRPVWMRLIDFVIADWWCVCESCRPDVEAARVDELARRLDAWEPLAGRPAALVAAFYAKRSGPAISRHNAQAEPNDVNASE